PRSAGTRTSLVLNVRCRALLSLPLALAVSSSARATPIQAPRPGARARTSGATSPSGDSASRISSAFVALRRVRTQVRSGPAPFAGLSEPRSSLRGVRIGGLLGLVRVRGGGRIFLEPVGAGGHDDLVALLFGQAVVGEDPALVLGPVARLAAARLDPLLLDQLVGGEIGQIVERPDPGLAERHQHLLGEVRNLGEIVRDAELAALLARGGLAPLERFRGAALQLGRDVVVEAFDRGDFLDRDVGDFLEAGEAFGEEQLGQSLIDVELGLEQGRALDELALALLARIGLGQDVDLRGGELAGEPDVLAAAADRQAEVVVGVHDLDPALLLVDDDAADGRRLQGVDDAGCEVLAPRDDVDLLALQLLDHRLNAAALHADAGADRVDRAVVADHADLGAAARVAGRSLDLDDAVVNLGHFLGEQLLHEVGMGARQEDLRAAGLAPHRHDQRADAVADADHFARDLLVAADDAFGAAEVDDDVAELDPLDHAGDDLGGAILEFLVLALALGVADLLEDHLLGGLGGDSAELDRRQRVDDEVADRGAILQLLRAFLVDLLEIILDLRNDLEHPPQAQVAGLGVELGADVVLGAVAGAGGALDRVLHGLDDDALVDQLLARDGVGDREQFRLVGADGGGCGSHVCIQPSILIVSAPSVLSGAVALMSLSVKSSLADEISEKDSAWDSSFLVRISTRSPSRPRNTPVNCFRPSWGSASVRRAS